MKHFSCFIFDLDGTLTHTNELIFATFNHVTEKYIGKTFTPVEITAMFGPPEEIAIERLVGKDKALEAINDFFEFYRNNLTRMAGAYDGTREILQYLKQQGVLMAVFTRKGRTSTLITLDAIGFSPFFDCIVTGTDVVNHKPSAEGIKKILTAFDIEPGEALMVGDAVGDIKAAREAGVTMASVLWDSYGKDTILKMDVDYMFHSVEEFSRWVKLVVPANGTIAVG